jgi:ferrous iron transport protein B
MNPAPAHVALTGNPNSGKTTIFNALTGLRAKVGNYAGVTVERKEGRLRGAPLELPVIILDLPGTYSLSPKSLDEQISRDVLFHRLPEVPYPGLVVVVVDASNLERNLYYATQVIELGLPTIVALNMIDVAEENGHHIDVPLLAEKLGVPVVPVVGNTGKGVEELRQLIISRLRQNEPASPKLFCDLPPVFVGEVEALAAVRSRSDSPANPRAEALLWLSDEKAAADKSCPGDVRQSVAAARQRLEAAGLDWRSAAIEARYASVGKIHDAVTTEIESLKENLSDRLDRVLTHKIWGTIIFVLIMLVMFQSIFTFAKIPMDALQWVFDTVGGQVGKMLPPGDLNNLLVDGVIAGVGAVIVFLPQILLLFLFIGFLEDTGYMARAAFLMDRLMSKVGLHGKSFIPMLSSYACAIPGIMAARTIETEKDRLATIMVAPLMGCSARLPVYTLLIGACIPNIMVFGFLKLQGLTMLAMYLLGTVVALLMAWLFKRTLLKGETPMLIMELPPYKRPLLRVVLRHMWDRSKIFLRRAGTVILGINILLWFLATYPKTDVASIKAPAVASVAPAADPAPPDDALIAGEKLRNSFAGRMGRAIEPVIAPLGFDWKIGIGIISSFAAREVFVSTMSTVYNVGSDDSEAGTKALVKTLHTQTRPDGSALYTPLLGLSLMVFYVFAMQCASTVVVVRRETNGWKWPLFQWFYMGALAWGLAFVTWQGGHLLGFH